jgi:hypothetical protein
MSETLPSVQDMDWKDIWLAPLINALLNPISRKRSHWWNWKENSQKIEVPTTVFGFTNAHPRTNLWHDFWQVNLIWQLVVILEPADEDFRGSWYLGFRIENEGGRGPRQQVCNLVLNGPVAALVGHEPTEFFGIRKTTGEQIPLQQVRTTNRTVLRKRHPEIPLL